MIPTFALFAVIADAWLLDIVVVSPAIAVVDVVPIASEDVPAPISVLISAADIFVLSDGTDPLDSTAGTPVSVTLAVLAVIAEACEVVIPVLAVLAVIALACAVVIVVMFDACVVVIPTLAVFAVIAEACDVVIPVLAVLAVIALACAEVIPVFAVFAVIAEA